MVSSKVWLGAGQGLVPGGLWEVALEGLVLALEVLGKVVVRLLAVVLVLVILLLLAVSLRVLPGAALC